MAGLGALINCAGIILGGLMGNLVGKIFKKEQQDSLTVACGISVLFIGIAGAMEEMMQVDQTSLVSSHSMLLVLSLAIGTIIGELIGIEDGFERFGQWLKIRSGNSKDAGFVQAFVTASLTVCIGAMAIVGSIEDGIFGDSSTLAIKAILDFIIIAVMTSSMGKGCIFSVIPVLILEGGVTLLSQLIRPLMTETAIANLSLTGSVLIFCVGINLVWGKKVRVANMLPAILAAIAFAFLPISL